MRALTSWRVVALAAVLGCLTAHAATPPALADVPLLHEYVQPSVAADINGHAGVHCVLDTGADIGVLNGALTRGADTAGRAKVTVANGLLTLQSVRVREVAIGEAHVRNASFIRRERTWIGKDQPMPCVLGGSVLGQFTVDLDGPAGRLRLYPRGTHIDEVLGSTPPPGSHLDGDVAPGNIFTTVTVGAQHPRARFDTGYDRSMANVALLDALGIGNDDARIETRVNTPPSGFSQTLRTVELERLGVGGVVEERYRFEVGDLAYSRKKPYVHLGADVLGRHRLLIDMAHHDVALLP